MTRAQSLLALIALLAACASSPPVDRGSGDATRPNVVVVFVDDLGAGELGCYGQQHIETPRIDSIAERGVRFTNGYTGSPVCAPSRCVLLTGKHSGHAEVRANWENGGWGPDEPEGQWPLSDEEVTLAERLGALGYRTAGYGKWGLGGPGTRGAPERQGFDHFYGYLCQRVAHNYYPTHLWLDGERAPIDGAEYFKAHQRLEAPLESDRAYYERFGQGSERYAPQLIADDMIDWLDEAAGGDEPFFLYYASIIPHLALQVPQEYVERYPAEWDAKPYLGQQSYLPHPSPRRAYAGMISFLDDQVGRILDTLEARGVAEDTIVLFTSDNGATYVGGVDTTFFQSHDARRGHKGQLYEGGIRVPFLASWPGHFPEGVVSDQVVSTVDVTATVLDLIGAPAATDADVATDSVSFAAAARGDLDAPARPYLYWEYRPAGAQAVRRGDWKLVRTGLKKGAPQLALYDLAANPAETQALDLSGQFPELVAELAALMDASHAPSEGFPLPTVDGDAAEIMKRRTNP